MSPTDNNTNLTRDLRASRMPMVLIARGLSLMANTTARIIYVSLFGLAFLCNFVVADENRDECHLDDMHAFGWWLNHKNETHVSPILPILQEQLRSVDTRNLYGNPQLSSRSLCSPDMSEAAPMHSRALCRWHYKINYDPKRIPSSIAEADCHCQQVTLSLTGGRPYRCTPLEYRIRVLKFDESCNTFIETLQAIALACIPTLTISAEAYQPDFNVISNAGGIFEGDY